MPHKPAETASGVSGARKRERRTPHARAEGQLVVLAVGDLSNWKASSGSLPWDSRIVFRDFRDVTEELLDSLRPDVVLSPLLCRHFDCLDLAQLLHLAGFKGRLRVMITDLPRPQIVLDEARALCPGLDIEYIVERMLQPGPGH